ncbi:MAG: hypothetical protein LBN40_06480 [Oscillospiraceae bacterium]|jgi:hypothetical protein|nr:hypothetical protein [Oscillospiraceae bacterium]
MFETKFIEQMVAKKLTAGDRVKQGLIIAGAVIIAAVSVLFALALPPVLLLGAAAIWVAWMLTGSFSTEYEYILTDNELDIDKITGKKKRKRLITIDLKCVKSWGQGEANDAFASNANVTIFAHDSTAEHLWNLTAEHDKAGKVVLYFSPSLEVAHHINFFVSNSLKKADLEPLVVESFVIKERLDDETK